MKYLRHFPLAFWAAICLILAGLLGYAQMSDTPEMPTRGANTVTVVDERSNVMALLARLATVHAAAAPPASGLAQWGLDTAAIAQQLADRRAAKADDQVAAAYREVAAASAGLSTVDPLNREQVLAGIATLGAAGNRLGAAVYLTDLPGAATVQQTPGTTSTISAPSAPSQVGTDSDSTPSTGVTR